MLKVGILEAHTIQTISIAKSLKKLGYNVILFCESQNSYGYHTRYADEKLIVPSIEEEEKKFHSFFLDFLKRKKVDALIPMFDYSAMYLSRHKEELSEFTEFVIPDCEIFMRGYDKNQFMRFCKMHGFPHPRTYDLSKPKGDNWKEEINFPALIKPNITNGARGFALVNSVPEVEKKLPEIIDNYGECHLQEFIPSGGKQFLVGIYTKNGEVVNATAIDKIRYYPVNGGSSCFCETVEREDLIQLCSKVQKKLGWEGYAHYDLIEDPRDGTVKLMELNPRVQGCIKSSYISGVDFGANIIQDTLGLQLKEYSFTSGKYLRYLGLDLLWFLKSKDRFSSSPRWFHGFLNSDHYYQDFSWDDPKPFIYGTLKGVLKSIKPEFRKSKGDMNQHIDSAVDPKLEAGKCKTSN